MNKNISPIKYPSMLLPKQIISPFKKVIPRNGNQSQQYNCCSPLEYINPIANPEMNKNMPKSAHGGNNNNNLSFLQSPVNKRQEKFTFVKQKSPRNQNHLQSETNEPMPFSGNNLNAETNVNCSHNRKLWYNQVSISSISPTLHIRKSEIKTNDQNEFPYDFPNPPDRKLSHHINTTTHNSQFLHKTNYNIQNNNLSYRLYQPNQNDLTQKKQYEEHSFQNKTANYNFYSLKSIPHDPKSPFNSVKQTKFRKHSDDISSQSKNGKTQLPSFLIKKIQKQCLTSQQQDIDNLYKHQDAIKVSSVCSEKKEKKFSLKDFKVLKQLGQGKFGKVLLVKQKATGFICAMKVFKKSQLKQDNFIDQFIRQLKIQFYLNHPNIIKMYGYFDDLSYIYVLLEGAFGGTLYQFLQGLQHDEKLLNPRISLTESGHSLDSLTGLSLKEAAYIMYQLCSAIKYLHSNNIIHRDLKPQNIVIHQKTIKLCDFGWSVFKGTEMRTTFCGTPLYLCPQLITGEQYNQKIDIWAIGIMLYQFLIGPNPFNIKKESDLANIIVQDIEINIGQNMIGRSQQLDKSVIDLIKGCLNKDPFQRLDIKQIVNHEFFKIYCPQLINSNNNSLSRHGSMSISQTFKQPTFTQKH